MIRFKSQLGGMLLGLLLVSSAALADDTEIFSGSHSTSQPANILLILDTSGSMSTQLNSQPAFDPATTYLGSCSASYYYFAQVPTRGRATIPTCSDTAVQIPVGNLRCANATGSGKNLASGGSGIYTDASGGFIQWNNTSHTPGTYLWQNTLTGTTTSNANSVECGAEKNTSSYPNKSSGTTLTPSYTTTAANSWWAATGNNGGSYTLYSANYLNYYYSAPLTVQTRLSTVQNAAKDMLDLVSGTNVGLMTYSYSGSGGMVRKPILSIDAAGVKDALKSEINSMVPSGDTPLSETMYEAYRYYSGLGVVFGGSGSPYASTACTVGDTDAQGLFTGNCDTSVYYPSAAASQSGGNYISPAQYSCQKNYIVYLTDGEPTDDNEADQYIEGSTTTTRTPVPGITDSRTCTSVPGRTWSNRSNTCYTTTTTTTAGIPNFQTVTGGCVGSGDGRCLSALAKYMYLSDLNSAVSGTENVTSYFIGFGTDFAGSNNSAFQYLQSAATAGGGQAYTATDYASLSAVLSAIASSVAAANNTSFSAPTVAVNAFNRTQTLDDLYVSVFEPGTTYHWDGNVKKYKVTDEVVVDSTGTAAVDPQTGFFKDGTQSFWSASPDGSTVTLGGAAHRLPDPTSRHIYTMLGSNAYNSTTSGVAVTDINTAITSANATAVLGLGGTDPTYTTLLSWAEGTDVKDENPPSDTSGIRHVMGDPVHSEPAALIYSRGTTGTGYDTVVFVTTNDGYLHAINATANADGTDNVTSHPYSGEELWSFIPQEILPDLKNLYANETTTTKHYSLDGPVRLLKFDVNSNGVVDSGDRVLLYFSTGRNSSVSRYYAMDVTDKNNPKFMWSLSPTELPGLGQTWSPPTVARVTVGTGANQNAQHLVLIFGGGYDPLEDSYGYVSPKDGVGNHIYMVDAKTGVLLWSAGPSTSTTDSFTSTRMTHAIPSQISVLDTDNDGYADRMYVGDMAGQVWRFDITNGGSPTSTTNPLVTGGVIASLGDKENTSHTSMTSVRRFYSPPDVALAEPVGGTAFFNISIGSGYRGHPLDIETQDDLYTLRDYTPFTKLTQAQYAALHLIVDSDLQDITTTLSPTFASGSYGWKLLLSASTGEKVLSAARTLDNIIYFVSYTPGSLATSTSDPCAVARASGTNKVYAVSLFTGAPVKDYNGDGAITLADRSYDSKQGGIAPGVSLLFPADHAKDVMVMSGAEEIGICSTCRALTKTYWHDNAAD
ncbi:MAG TPA: hypothetical protein VMI92_10680 [Steroidobacteraceae bacterium]|nr:hypothetical protein [Steroidobacteraceae bacterium]